MRVSTHTPRPGSRTEDRTRRTNEWGTGNRGVESHALPPLTPPLKHPFTASEERKDNHLPDFSPCQEHVGSPGCAPPKRFGHTRKVRAYSRCGWRASGKETEHGGAYNRRLTQAVRGSSLLHE